MFQLGIFLPGYCIRIHHWTADLHRIDVFRNINDISLTQDNVIVTSRIKQSLFHIDAYCISLRDGKLVHRDAILPLTTLSYAKHIRLTPTFLIIALANQTSPLYICRRSNSACTTYHITQTFILLQQRIAAAEKHLTRNCHHALNLVGRTATNLDYIERLQVETTGTRQKTVLDVKGECLRKLAAVGSTLGILDAARHAHTGSGGSLSKTSRLDNHILYR